MNENVPNESQLTLSRRKPRSIIFSLSYRAKHLASIIFGKERTLRFFLTGSWLFWRFAFELSGNVYGNGFHCHAKGLSEDFLRRWIPENGSVIDIGCNTGQWSRIATKYARSVVGIDLNADHIRRARETTKEENVEFVCGDATTDLKGRKFDLAIVIHVLEHIDDPDTFLIDLKHVTSTIIIEVPDFENDPLNWVRWTIGSPYYSDGDHVREYTLDILFDQLVRNGWAIIEHKKHGGAILVAAQHAVGDDNK